MRKFLQKCAKLEQILNQTRSSIISYCCDTTLGFCDTHFAKHWSTVLNSKNIPSKWKNLAYFAINSTTFRHFTYQKFSKTHLIRKIAKMFHILNLGEFCGVFTWHHPVLFLFPHKTIFPRPHNILCRLQTRIRIDGIFFEFQSAAVDVVRLAKCFSLKRSRESSHCIICKSSISLPLFAQTRLYRYLPWLKRGKRKELGIRIVFVPIEKKTRTWGGYNRPGVFHNFAIFKLYLTLYTCFYLFSRCQFCFAFRNYFFCMMKNRNYKR